MTSDNLYTVDQSTSSVKSQVTTFELLKDAGERIKVVDLPAEIEVYSYPNGLNNLNYTYVNLSATTDSPMFFIELRLNETNVVPVLIVRPDDTTANITYYVRKGGIPSQHTYDMKGFILTDSEVEDSTNSYLVKMDISGLWTGRERLPTMVYIGLEADYNITEVSPMAEVAVLVLGCYYWSEQDKQWSQRGVKCKPAVRLVTEQIQ
ncbi:uncharacterized protein [Mytilus edulis]|uniref:uncharacterized protein n=1 Tax=Mytilus edulis TaxID=6550 RepID=UPI0039EEF121